MNQPLFSDLRMTFSSQEEAVEVMKGIEGQIRRHGVATVGDLHRLVDEPTTHVEDCHGWTQLGVIVIVRVDDEYWLEFPPTQQIER